MKELETNRTPQTRFLTLVYIDDATSSATSRVSSQGDVRNRGEPRSAFLIVYEQQSPGIPFALYCMPQTMSYTLPDNDTVCRVC